MIRSPEQWNWKPAPQATSSLRMALHHSGTRRDGMTVLELLIVIGMMALLLALIFPAIQSARESARRVQCIHNLRQLGLALHMAHEQESRLPTGWSADPRIHTAWSWTARLLPFLDQLGAYESLHLQEPIDSDANVAIRTTRIPGLICPSDLVPSTFTLFAESSQLPTEAGPHSGSLQVLAELPSTNYLGIFGDQDPDVVDGHTGSGTFLQDRRVGWRDLSQGLSHVMVIGERTARKMPSTWLGVHIDGEDAPGRMTGYAWYGPNRSDSDECELDSRHAGLINAVFADGHVESISDAVDPLTYRRMARREH